jgi:hypothetical protein
MYWRGGEGRRERNIFVMYLRIGEGGGSGGPLEGVGPETHVHEISMYLFINLPALGLNDFDAGKFMDSARIKIITSCAL